MSILDAIEISSVNLQTQHISESSCQDGGSEVHYLEKTSFASRRSEKKLHNGLKLKKEEDQEETIQEHFSVQIQKERDNDSRCS